MSPNNLTETHSLITPNHILSKYTDDILCQHRTSQSYLLQVAFLLAIISILCLKVILIMLVKEKNSQLYRIDIINIKLTQWKFISSFWIGGKSQHTWLVLPRKGLRDQYNSARRANTANIWLQIHTWPHRENTHCSQKKLFKNCGSCEKLSLLSYIFYCVIQW